MLWTLVYIIIVQDGRAIDTTSWETGFQFRTQQECIATADQATPGLIGGAAASVGPDDIGGPKRNTVTLRPVCFPAPLSLR